MGGDADLHGSGGSTISPLPPLPPNPFSPPAAWPPPLPGAPAVVGRSSTGPRPLLLQAKSQHAPSTRHTPKRVSVCMFTCACSDVRPHSTARPPVDRAFLQTYQIPRN